jgi:hypothetical protein
MASALLLSQKLLRSFPLLWMHVWLMVFLPMLASLLLLDDSFS